MTIYEASSRSTLVTASALAPLFWFHAAARPCRIREIQIFSITAPTTSGALGLMRSTAIATGALTGMVGLPRNTNNVAAVGQVVTAAATTSPTVGAVTTVMRRWASPASLGNGVVWSFWEEDGLWVPANAAVNSELVIVNLNATAPGTFDFNVIWEE